jgi:hypothetical protein
LNIPTIRKGTPAKNNGMLRSHISSRMVPFEPQNIFWIACWVVLIVSLDIGCDNLLKENER